VAEKRLEVRTDEGVIDGRLFVPHGGAPWPLVVFYHDAGGLRPAMSTMAERLVDTGYAVLQPNLFWRAGPHHPFQMETVWGDPEERKRLMALLHSVDADHVMADTKLLIGAAAETGVRGEPGVKAEKVGCLGYCLGGRMAFLAAAELASRVVAAASIHGGALVTSEPDSPHLRATDIRATLYLAVADEDRGCTPEHQAALRAALEGAGVPYTLELYSGARHGFAVPDVPVYDREASERHWERVLALFDTVLRPAVSL
jgi:carboxymethylenebutenolidase